jgi:L-alanine-DL-glutamate epimerase-like enolase superfamily enzyme
VPEQKIVGEDVAHDFPMKSGVITVPDKPGIGLEINHERLDEHTLEKTVFNRKDN